MCGVCKALSHAFFKLIFMRVWLLYNVATVYMVTQLYVHIHPLSSGFPSHLGHTEPRVEFPELYRRLSLVTVLIFILCTVSLVYVCSSQSPNSSSLPSLLGVHTVVLYLWVSTCVLQIRSSFYHYMKFHLLKYLTGSSWTHRVYQRGQGWSLNSLGRWSYLLFLSTSGITDLQESQETPGEKERLAST